MASALLSPQDWFSLYGKHYDINSTKRLRILCSSTLKSKRRSHCETLPAGWHCVRNGHRLNGYRLFIYRTDANMRLNLGPSRRRSAHATELPPAVETAVVERVFSVLFTASEWLVHVGSPTYGFTDITYVDQLLRGRPWGNSKVSAALPPGWNAVRVGRSRLAYHDSLLPKELWIKSLV